MKPQDFTIDLNPRRKKYNRTTRVYARFCGITFVAFSREFRRKVLITNQN